MRIRVFGHYVHLSMAVLTLIEAVLFFLALYIAAFVRFRIYGDPRHIPDLTGALWPRALLFSAVIVLCLLALGLYSVRQRARFTGMLVRVAVALLASFAITAMIFYTVPDVSIGRGVMGLATFGAACGIGVSRLIFALVVDEETFKKRVLIYGVGNAAGAIVRLRRRSDRRGFRIVGFVQPAGEEPLVPPDQLIRADDGLARVCERLEIAEIVVAMDDRRRGFPVAELLECRMAGIEITELLTFLERETGRVRVDVLNPSWIIFSDGFRRDHLRQLSSRAMDMLASLVLLLVSLPVMVLTALAIKVEEGWGAPVFYRQSRVGCGGRDFDVLKFRSMRCDAECDGRAQWALKQDPRITHVGAVIRKLRIDELPQIVNVLRGEMAFVGPRPERPQFVEELAQNIPYYRQRLCVKPGITGWAQLCYPYGWCERDAVEKLQYDLYYVKNKGLLFDLSILLQTAEVVLLGKGAR